MYTARVKVYQLTPVKFKIIPMKKICSTLVVFFALIGFVAAQGIEFFHGTWVEALAEAKKQEKPIFVDAYTTWCGPCQMMSKNVFTHADVGAFFNENFTFIFNYIIRT